MLITRLTVALTVMVNLAKPVPAQTSDTAIPASVRRHLAQAIWPRNLFDSSGRPEAGFVRAPFEPAFEDLRISAAVQTVRALPGVRFYVGNASPHACMHCAAQVRAVAHRDSSDVALLGLNDIDLLLPWVTPLFIHGDSVRIREFILQVLSATTFVNGPRQVFARSDIPDVNSAFFKPSDNRAKSWQMPRTNTHVSPGQMQMEFAVYGGGEGLFRVLVQQQQDGRFLAIEVLPVAHWRMY